MQYEATIESLDRHPLPDWYADAKLGFSSTGAIFRAAGAVSHPEHDFANQDYIKNNPYAEWYYNSMRIEGSPTQKYHRENTAPSTTTTTLPPSLTGRSKSGIRTFGRK